MAQAVLGNYTKNSTNGTASSLTLSKPTGVENGDLLLLLVGNENSANGEGFDTLTGWTLEFNYGSGNVDTYIALYSRIATGDTLEDSPVVPFLASDDGHGWYIDVKNIDTSNPISPVGTGIETVSNAITITALTAASDSLAISTFSFDGADSDPINETGVGWTLEDWTESPIGSDAGGASSGAWSTKTMASSGSTEASVFNCGGGQIDGLVGAMFIINGQPSVYGSATINDGTSSVTSDGIINYIYEGSATLSTPSSFTVYQTIIHQIDTEPNRASIINTSSVTVNGTLLQSSVFNDVGVSALLSVGDAITNGTANTSFDSPVETVTLTPYIVSIEAIQNVLVEDDGITQILTPNDVTINTNVIITDIGTTATFSIPLASVTGEGSTFYNDIGTSINVTMNDVSVDVVYHLTIDDEGSALDVTVNTPIVLVVSNIAINAGISSASFLSNDISIVTSAYISDVGTGFSLIPNEVFAFGVTEIAIDVDLLELNLTQYNATVDARTVTQVYVGSSSLDFIVHDVEVPDHITIQDFPATCIIEEGYTQTPTRGVKCLGGGYKSGIPIVTATAIFNTNKEMNDFYFWWVHTTERGLNPFTIDLIIMGIRRDWMVKIVEGFTTSVPTAYTRKVPFKFELVDVVTQFLPTTSYGFVYPSELGCITVDGYAETSGSGVRCLGDKIQSRNETMSGTIMVTDTDALSKLASWYITELDYGNFPFVIDLPFMGTTASWTVKFVDTPVHTLLTNQTGKLAVKFELLDYAPSEFIDNILYTMDTFIVNNGKHFVENTGYNKPDDDAEMFGSNWVDLTATGADVNLPKIDDLVNSYVTYNDYATGMHKTISASGDEGVDLVYNGNFTLDFAGWASAQGTITIKNNAIELRGNTISEYPQMNQDIPITGMDVISSVDVLEISNTANEISLNVGGYTYTASGYPTPTTVSRVTRNCIADTLIIESRESGDIDQYALFDNVKTVQILPLTSTYNMASTFQSYFTTDVPVTEVDRVILNANPNAIYDIWFDDVLTGLSFTRENIKNLISATEGALGGDTLYDIVTGITYTINGFVAETRTNLENVSEGASSFRLETDENGMATGSTGTYITGKDDGRFLRLPLTTPVDFVPLDDINTISGTKNSLTVHFSDGSEVVVT